MILTSIDGVVFAHPAHSSARGVGVCGSGGYEVVVHIAVEAGFLSWTFLLELTSRNKHMQVTSGKNPAGFLISATSFKELFSPEQNR